MRMVEPGQGAGFIKEPGQAPVVVLRIRAGLRHHRVPLCPGGKLTGQVFLDGHELIQVGIIGPIGDAEAPGPQYRIQSVFLKARAGRQGVHVVDGHGRVQVPGCSGWVDLIVGQALRQCQSVRLYAFVSAVC